MRRALVAEDNDSLMILLTEELKRQGYEVSAVSSSAQALLLVRGWSQEEIRQLEVAVLDYDLADGRGKGAEVASELRALAWKALLVSRPWIISLSSQRPEERGFYDVHLDKDKVNIVNLRAALAHG